MYQKIDQAAKTFIIHCIVQRLSVKESLAYLRSHDINISKATFLGHKRKIKESRFTRMRELADTGFIDYHLDSIDTLEWAKKELVANYYKLVKNDPYRASEIITQIVNLLPYFAEYIAESKQVMEHKAISESQTNKETITL